MKSTEYAVALDMVLMIARVACLVPTEEMLNAVNMAETVGPIVDPTLYRKYLYKGGGQGDQIKQIISAVNHLKHVAEKVQYEQAAKREKDAMQLS